MNTQTHEPTTIATDELTTEALVQQYLDVCNRACAAHEDDAILGKLLDLTRKYLGVRTFVIAVYGRDPSAPHDHFTVRFADGRFEYVSHGKRGDARFTWKAQRGYLEHVVANPQTYIERPARLDWDWLKSRIGMTD